MKGIISKSSPFAAKFESPLSLTRAEIAKRPNAETIAAKIEEANRKLQQKGNKLFLPSIYTR
jgi:hypothetical protein